MAGSTVGPVLLVESDEGVIKDVTCSLRLMDINVISALSVDEALSSLRDRRASLILTRLAVDSDDAVIYAT